MTEVKVLTSHHTGSSQITRQLSAAALKLTLQCGRRQIHKQCHVSNFELTGSESSATNKLVKAAPYPAVLPLSILLFWLRCKQQPTLAPCASQLIPTKLTCNYVLHSTWFFYANIYKVKASTYTAMTYSGSLQKKICYLDKAQQKAFT